MSRPESLPRSFLYVPGHRPELIGKARRSDADAVVLDLEDAVPVSEKESARRLVAEHLADCSDSGPQLWVRVSAEQLEDDLAIVTGTGLHGIFVAKCDAQRAATVAAKAGQGVSVVGLIESAVALRDIDQLASAGHVSALAVGLVDLLADLRISAAANGAVESIFLRIVIASAAAALLPPIAPTQTDFRDLDSFRASSRSLIAQGFRSRTAIHPSQIDIINDEFEPKPEEVEAALEMLDRFARAGGGAFVGRDGRMVDAAVVRGAQEVIGRARALRTADR